MSKGHSKRRHVIDFAVTVGGAVLLVCVAILLALRSGRREAPLPPVPEATSTPGEVRVKPVVRKDAARKPAVAASTSRTVAIICGEHRVAAAIISSVPPQNNERKENKGVFRECA